MIKMLTYTSLVKMLGPDGLDGLVRGKLFAHERILCGNVNATGSLGACATLLIKNVNLSDAFRGRSSLRSSLRKDGQDGGDEEDRRLHDHELELRELSQFRY